MTTEELLRVLREADALRDSVEQRPDRVMTDSMSAIPPDYAGTLLEDRLDSRLVGNLCAAGITSLYRHQKEAVEFALDGQDIVLECPTASGKTLCFNIPIIQKLAESKDGHALMLFPMKALARDQVRQFTELSRGMTHVGGRSIEVWTYDGDTPDEDRKAMRDRPLSVLATNPEMLHMTFLGHRQTWERFLRKLKVVVIDEIHEYRGYFGTQVSILLRRFFAHLTSLDVRPQVILATATCANPEEHARRLTGRECTLVRAETAWAPQRNFMFISPDAIPEHDFPRIFKYRVAKAAIALEKAGLSTIVFCPSRNFVEDAMKQVFRVVEKEGGSRQGFAPYRAGYSADDREAIENGLRDGSIKVVFTTNALEVGIDIGKLDACILAGFPDSTMSAWQRIGRVGRAPGKPAQVIYYAMNNAFDRFYAENLPMFLKRHLDEIFVGVDNEELMKQHLPYLLAESGWGDRSEAVNKALGEPLVKFAAAETKGARPAAGAKLNYQKLGIRGSSGAQLTLKAGGKEIGSISEEQAFREAYEGAIYHHMGQSYRVVSRGGGDIQLEEAEPSLRTDPRFYTTMTIREVMRGVRFDCAVSQSYGKVDLYRNYEGYHLVNDRDEVIDRVSGKGTLPRSVRAAWFDFEHGNPVAELILQGGLRAMEHLLRIGALFAVPCDRHDIDTFLDNKGALNRVYFLETVEGGIGLADRAYDVWRSILKRGMEIARSCVCNDGCPRCLHPPRYRVSDGVISKKAGLEFGERLLELTQAPPSEEFDSGINGWRPIKPKENK